MKHLQLFEEFTSDIHGIELYHGTTEKLAEIILEGGMNSPSYWTDSLDLAYYYAGESIDDPNDETVILTIDLKDLDEEKCLPDMPSLYEPITSVLDLDEDALWDNWVNSSQDWKASLELVSSIRYDGYIRPELISMLD